MKHNWQGGRTLLPLRAFAVLSALADGSRQIIDLAGPGHRASECNRHSAETPGLTRLEVVA
ncbi:hypothetical protein ACWKW9_19050 [Rhizobium daejeonense]